MNEKIVLPSYRQVYFALQPDYSKVGVRYRVIQYLWHNSPLDRQRFVRGNFHLSREEADEEKERLNSLLLKIEMMTQWKKELNSLR